MAAAMNLLDMRPVDSFPVVLMIKSTKRLELLHFSVVIVYETSSLVFEFLSFVLMHISTTTIF